MDGCHGSALESWRKHWNYGLLLGAASVSAALVGQRFVVINCAAAM